MGRADKPGEKPTIVSNNQTEPTGLNLLELADNAGAKVKQFVNEIDWKDIYTRLDGTVKDFRESASKAADRVNEALKTPTSPDQKLEPEAFARQALKNFSFYSSSTDIRLAAEALSKVHANDPSLAKSIIAEARKEPRRFGSSSIDAAEEMFQQALELAEPVKDITQGWAKYDKIRTNMSKVLNEPLDSPASHRQAAELVASMLTGGSKCGKEAVSEIRSSIHLPDYQGKLDLAVQDGRALAAIRQQNPGDTPDASWQKLEALDQNLKKAAEAANATAPEDEKIALSREAFSRALSISKQATDLRLPYFSGTDTMGKAWEQALKMSRQG